MGYLNKTLYFEQQNNSLWYEYFQNKLVGNYTQIFANVDMFRDPYVIIAKIDKPYVIVLTEGKYFWGKSMKELSLSRFVIGYWGQEAKRDGTKLIVLLLCIRCFSINNQ